MFGTFKYYAELVLTTFLGEADRGHKSRTTVLRESRQGSRSRA